MSSPLPLRCLVVLPTYDEAENILPLSSEVLAVAPEIEVLVVDDASPDGTGDLVAERADWLTDDRALLIALAIGVVSAIISCFLIRRSLRAKSDLPLTDQIVAVERVFAPLVVITSCSVAFAHGANDVANAIGPLATIVDLVATGAIKAQVSVPAWVLILGGCGIVIGLATYGHRVMHTVGVKITEITPSRGIAANIAATITVLACTRMKMPVSTTHTLVGAVLGVGLARGIAALNLTVIRTIVVSWVITLPAGATLSIIFYYILRAIFSG